MIAAACSLLDDLSDSNEAPIDRVASILASAGLADADAEAKAAAAEIDLDPFSRLFCAVVLAARTGGNGGSAFVAPEYSTNNARHYVLI